MKNSRKRTVSKERRINPHYWVFCEGDTEKAYICYLRSKYRVYIEIIPKISGSSINKRFISDSKKGKPIHDKDLNFLLYDADDPNITEKLNELIKTAPDTKLLLSNPCIELWFLLHYDNQTRSLSSLDCRNQLRQYNKTYKKGDLNRPLKKILDENEKRACSRGKKLMCFENPSSNIFEFIAILEKIKRGV